MNATCSRCNSLEDASMLLEELRLFDDRVYGVAHGLLTGSRDTIWVQALCLFDEVKQLDTSTASAFYNALTDVLWHFGQVSSTYYESFFLASSFVNLDFRFLPLFLVDRHLQLKPDS